jgi:hypothetical protein
MKNILEAEIAPVSGGPDVVEARLGDGIVLRAQDPWRNGAASGVAAIGFRPVDVEVQAGEGEVGPGIAGMVTRRLFLGDVAHYTIRSGALEISAQDRPRAELAEGQRVRWRVAPERCLVLRE